MIHDLGKFVAPRAKIKVGSMEYTPVGSEFQSGATDLDHPGVDEYLNDRETLRRILLTFLE